MEQDINQLSINAIRCTGVDMINKANSGHPGIVLGAAPMMHTLFTKHLQLNPKNPKWINRDRIVFSAGHGSALLYTMLHFSGFDISLEDLKEFRQLHSITPGHPEYGQTPGVDTTTGPLGQGIASAVGMAIAEAHMSSQYNKKDFSIIDHYTYVLCGDGDLEEGISYEACSLAGCLKLNKLIVLFDSNKIQLDGPVKDCYIENTKSRFEAMGWSYLVVEDGTSCDDISSAIEEAKASSDKPTIIEVKTTIGFGAPKEGTNAVHGSPLGEEGREVLAKNLGYSNAPFDIPQEVYSYYKENVEARGEAAYKEWEKSYAAYKVSYPEFESLFSDAIEDKISMDFNKLQDFDFNDKQATRAMAGKFVDAIGSLMPNTMGGSADLVSSTKIKGADGLFSAENRLGRNIKFGVREHAMAAICNGITIHGGLRAFCAGFFVFSDYMKPAIRLSAIQNIPTAYIFSHDSVYVGEDGPTHEPIEQLTMLRSIPNLNVIRPCDSAEVRAALQVAFTSKSTPTVVVTTRQKVTNFRMTSFEKTKMGAYVLYEPKEEPTAIIIASGSEVELALASAYLLEKEGAPTRVVSMPSQYLFDKQSSEYKEEVLPKHITNTLAIELGSPLGLYKYANKVLGISRFGESAPASHMAEIFGFTTDNVKKLILED